ncbi:MAG TPA: NUDIX domain-containing protein [Patescibacteria group bacterium]|nr:NUDIX domain-containing protein [Patescibacteria group bacterium]
MNEQKFVRAGFGVMLIKDNKILLGHRHIDPQKADSVLNGAGSWTMPGGKFEFGETFEEGAKREVMEETGIKLNEVEIFCVNNERMAQAHFVTIGIVSADFSGEPQVMEPDEITQWKWFALDNLPSPMFFPSVEMIDNYKKKEFYIENHNNINSHI